MEGSDGSSRKLKLDSTGGATQGRRAWLSAQLDDRDDPLLDLSDERETQQTENRLLLDFESTDDAAERLPRKDFPTESGTVSSEVISKDYQTAATAATVKQPGSGTSHAPTGLATEGPLLAWSDSDGGGSGGVDYFGSGDPTFLNTNLPSFPVVPPRLSEMDVHTDSWPAFSDTSHAVCESSPLRPTSLTTSAALLSSPPPPLHTQQGVPHWKGGGTPLNRRSDAGASDGVGPVNKTERGLPDVATRQPLLPLPQSRSQYQSHLTHPATTAAQGETLTVASASSSSCSSATHTEAPSSPVSGFVIDYSHNAAMGNGEQMPHAYGNSNLRGDFPQNVMLASFPPPSSRENGAGVATEGRSYGAFTLDTHCHSATNRHSMNDSLARQQLLIVLVLCVLFMIGETVGGVLANSLALFTDVLHLASDLISYGISLLALYLSRKPATRGLTFGYHRAEVLGALFSVFIIWLVSGVLCYIAVERIVHKHYKDVKPNEMLITASLGVVFNLVMGFVLHSEKCCGVAKGHAKFGHGHSHSHSHSHSQGNQTDRYEYEPLDVASQGRERSSGEDEPHEGAESSPVKQQHKSINVRAAFIHVVGDIIQSLGVLVAALIIKFTENEEYRLADPICTFVFSLLVLCTTVNVLKDTLRIIMEGVPQGVDYEQLRSLLMSLESVVTVHNLNVWALTMDRNALSVHLAVDPARNSNEVLADAMLALKRHDFVHITIQVEPYSHDVMSACTDCQLPVK